MLLPFVVQAECRADLFAVTDEFGDVSRYELSEPYYHQKERGWFWYETLPEAPAEQESVPETKKPVEKSKTEQTQQTPSPKLLSSEWFRQHLTAYRDQAIDQPTPENVTAYLYLQRIMLPTFRTPYLVKNDLNCAKQLCSFGDKQ